MRRTRARSARLLTGLALVLALLLARAAPAAAEDVAVVKSEGFAPYDEVAGSFSRAMPSGWIGYTLAADGANADYVARSLRRQAPAVVVAVGPRAARVARLAAPLATLLCVLVDDPERLKLGAGRLAWLGAQAGPEDVLKGLKAVAPAARSLGIVTGSGPRAASARFAATCSAHGIEVHAFEARSSRDVPEQLRRAIQESDALWFLSDPVSSTPASFEFARRLCRERHIPMLVFSEDLARAGGVLSVSPDYAALGRQIARLAQKSLAGAPPAGAVPYASDISTLTLNTRAAADIGLVLPEDLTSLVQHVIR